MLQPPNYQQPNPKHAVTFFVVSIAVLLLPVFWNPHRNDRVGGPLEPLGTPLTVGELEARQAQGQVPAEAQGQAPSGAQGQAPSEGQGQAPGEAQARAPGEAQAQAPGEAQAQALGEARAQAAGEARAQAAGEAQRQAPGEAQRQAPGEAQLVAAPNAPVTATGVAQAAETAYQSMKELVPQGAPSGLPDAAATPPTSEVAAAEEQAGAFGARPQGYEDPTVAFSRELRRGIISLLLTILVIGVSLRMLKNRLPGLAGVGAKPGKLVNILAREALGPTQSIAVVQVGGKILLVGLSDHGMNTLAELTEADIEAVRPAEAPVEQPVEKKTAQNLYRDVLRHYLSIVPGMGANKK